MPTFINKKFSSEGLEEPIYSDLIQMLPLDLPLQDLLKVKSDVFWRRKLLRDYKVNVDQPEAPGHAVSLYFKLFLERLFEGRRPKNWFTHVPFLPDAQLEQILNCPEIHITELTLHLTPGFPHTALLKKLKLESLCLIYKENEEDFQTKFSTKDVEQPQNETQVDEDDADDEIPKKKIAQLPLNTFLLKSPEIGQDTKIRGRTLPELAELTDGDTYNSVFPFHQLYNDDKMKSGRTIKQKETFELLKMSRRGKISDMDVAALKTLFPEAPAAPAAPAAGNAENQAPAPAAPVLKRLAVHSSGLTNQQVGPLTVLLATSNVECLNLSNNEVDDLSELTKLFATVPGRCSLKVVDLSRNFIRENGAAQLMKALQFESCGVEMLNLEGNYIQNGFLLIFNGILGAAIKFNNKTLKWLDIADCSIQFKPEHGDVIVKLFTEAGLKYLRISGNHLDELPLDEIQEQIKALDGTLVARGANASQQETQAVSTMQTAPASLANTVNGISGPPSGAKASRTATEQQERGETGTAKSQQETQNQQ